MVITGVLTTNRQHMLLAMMLPDHLAEQRRARGAERRAAQQRAAESSEKVQMRVPVYFDELAVGLRLAVYGDKDPLLGAMCAHNQHLVRHGMVGDIETGQ